MATKCYICLATVSSYRYLKLSKAQNYENFSLNIIRNLLVNALFM